MSEITGGELFARALQAEGIEFLFGLPSSAWPVRIMWSACVGAVIIPTAPVRILASRRTLSANAV